MFVDESNAIITVSVEVQYLVIVVVVAVIIPMQGRKKPASLLKVTCRHLNRSNGVKTSANPIDRFKRLDKRSCRRIEYTIFNDSTTTNNNNAKNGSTSKCFNTGWL